MVEKKVDAREFSKQVRCSLNWENFASVTRYTGNKHAGRATVFSILSRLVFLLFHLYSSLPHIFF